MPVLACPVRACLLPLRRTSRAWTCANGHSFDVARSGYVNLLQPQDRRSAHAGDSREAIDARLSLLTDGVGAGILDAFVRRASTLLEDESRPFGQSTEPRAKSRLDSGRVVVDLGCGAGDALARLQAMTPSDGIGIDLSAPAIDRAARRFPSLTWVVANADRRLPLPDASVSLLLSLHARRNPAEADRVLAPGGHLLIAVPAADDLVELREAVQGARVERDRVADVIHEHRDAFEPIARDSARERHRLDATQLQALLRGTYRGARTSEASRIATLERLEVTLASEFIVFRRRGEDGGNGSSNSMRRG